MNGSELDLSAVVERLETLNRKIYEISEFGMGASDAGTPSALQRTMELRNYRSEARALTYLLELAEQVNSQKALKTWQVILMGLSSAISLIGSAVAIWIAMQ